MSGRPGASTPLGKVADDPVLRQKGQTVSLQSSLQTGPSQLTEHQALRRRDEGQALVTLLSKVLGKQFQAPCAILIHVRKVYIQIRPAKSHKRQSDL